MTGFNGSQPAASKANRLWVIIAGLGVALLVLSIALMIVGTRKRSDDSESVARRAASKANVAAAIVVAVCQRFHKGEEIQADELNDLGKIEMDRKWLMSTRDNLYHLERVSVFKRYDGLLNKLLQDDCQTEIQKALTAATAAE